MTQAILIGGPKPTLKPEEGPVYQIETKLEDGSYKPFGPIQTWEGAILDYRLYDASLDMNIRNVNTGRLAVISCFATYIGEE